jgi:hypothetical protein
MDKLLMASEKIHKASTRGSGNYMVISSAVANIINDLRKSIRKEKIKRLFGE